MPLNCIAYWIGYQWSNASTTNSPFWLTRQGRAEVHHIWPLSLVTMCHLVHWDRRTNCCLAVLTHPSSRRTRHFLFVCQRSGMTCLLTDVWQLLSIVLNTISNANYFTSCTLITPSNSHLSRRRFRFFAWTYRHVTNWFWFDLILIHPLISFWPGTSGAVFTGLNLTLAWPVSKCLCWACSEHLFAHYEVFQCFDAVGWVAGRASGL